MQHKKFYLFFAELKNNVGPTHSLSDFPRYIMH